MIYILIVLLLTILYIAYRLMDNDFISPAFLFITPFCIALICSSIYAKKWLLDLHYNTFFVLLIGCLTFAITCILIHLTYGKRKKRKLVQKKELKYVPIDVETWKIIIIIVIQMCSIYIVISSMRASLSRYGISGNLTIIMYYYRSYSMFSDKYAVGISGLAMNLRIFSIAVSYIWAYVISNNTIIEYKTKNKIYMIISFVLGIINSVILGSRGEAIQLIVAFIIIYLTLQKKLNNWKSKVKFKQVVMLIAIVGVMFITFKGVGDLLGRSSVVATTTTVFDETAKYLGAEIKNLDLFLENYTKSRQVWGSQTFGVILDWIDNTFKKGWNIQSMLIFRKVNGVSLGNVYSTFGPFVYDFGYIGGSVIMPMVSAAIVQVLYENILSTKDNKGFNFMIILNSYILFLIMFSFFGERLCSSLLNFSFYKYLLSWWAVILFIAKIKIRYSNIRNRRGGLL